MRYVRNSMCSRDGRNGGGAHGRRVGAVAEAEVPREQHQHAEGRVGGEEAVETVLLDGREAEDDAGADDEAEDDGPESPLFGRQGGTAGAVGEGGAVEDRAGQPGDQRDRQDRCDHAAVKRRSTSATRSTAASG